MDQFVSNQHARSRRQPISQPWTMNPLCQGLGDYQKYQNMTHSKMSQNISECEFLQGQTNNPKKYQKNGGHGMKCMNHTFQLHPFADGNLWCGTWLLAFSLTSPFAWLNQSIASCTVGSRGKPSLLSGWTPACMGKKHLWNGLSSVKLLLADGGGFASVTIAAKSCSRAMYTWQLHRKLGKLWFPVSTDKLCRDV